MKHLYIILFVLPLIVFGQGWEQSYVGDNHDYGWCVQQTLDGGYIIIGNDVIKTDENGSVEWINENILGSMYFPKEGQQTFDGGYVMIGGNNLIKTDENGEEQWSQTFQLSTGSLEEKSSVQQTFDGGYILCGNINNNGNVDIHIIKTDENGEEEWSQTFGETGDDKGFSVKQTFDGGYIITGYITLGITSSGVEDRDIYLIKTDENGEEEWSQFFWYGTYWDYGHSVQQTVDGGYVITGKTTLGLLSTVNEEVCLIKTDENGEEEWFQTFGVETGGPDYDVGYSIQQTNDGGYIITGHTYSGGIDVYLIKTDQNGEEEWSQTFGGGCSDYGRSVKQTNDGGYIITGYTCSFGGEGYDIYLIKTDSEGNVETTSTIELPTPKSKRELVKTTNILGQENTTIKNQPLIEIYDDGSVEKKYIIE